MSSHSYTWPNFKLTQNKGEDIQMIYAVLMDQTNTARSWRSHMPPPIEATIKSYAVKYWPEALVLAQADSARFQDWSHWCPALIEICIRLLRDPETPADPQMIKRGWRTVLAAADLSTDRATLKILCKSKQHAVAAVGLPLMRSLLGDRRKRKVLQHCPELELESLRLLHDVAAEDVDLNLLSMVRQPPAPCLRDGVYYQYQAVCRLRQWLGQKPYWPYHGVRISRDRLRQAVGRLEAKVMKMRDSDDFALPTPPFAMCAHGDFLIEPLSTVPETRHEATEMHHCLVSYLPHILSGKNYAYRILRPQRCTVLLEKLSDRWLLAEIRAADNAIPNQKTQQLIFDWLGLGPSDHIEMETIIPF